METMTENINQELNLDTVKNWLNDNLDKEDVKNYVKELNKLDVNTVKDYLQSDEGVRLIQPMMDKRVTEALKTYKENHYNNDLKAAVAAEILRLNPKETEEQKRIRELEEREARREAEWKRDILKRQIVEEAARNNVPSWWVDDFAGNTIEEAKVFIEKIKSSYDETGQKAKNEILSQGYKPNSGNDSKEGKIDFSKMSEKEAYEKALALEMSNELDQQI